MSQLLDQARQNLKDYWGYPGFREGQEEAVSSVLHKKDTLVLFPTGGGKSLCYQVPATVFDGMTVVISPLVALMQDQVDQLKAKGVPATFINSTIPKKEVEQRLVNARNHMYKLMYCAPERLETELWKSYLPELPIEMIAVDEAHCISEWGHDFRPSYRNIKTAVAPVSDKVRWLALTATATPEVRDDIINSLDLNTPRIVSLGFERTNLKWWVLKDEQKEKRLLDTIKKAPGSGLVYAGTRNGCEYLAGQISEMGISSKAYHAGLDDDEREKIQQEWISGKVRIVVATNAFGMGIDKSDCRFVIHYDMPYSIEAYYQEAGRAGRDGEESYPILICKQGDYPKARRRIEESYPNREQLVTVYDRLCDYWNIAVGSAMPEPRAIPFEKLSEHTNLPEKSVRAGVSILDRLGLVEIIKSYEHMIGVRFAISRDALQDTIRTTKNPAKADFTDRLARAFGPQSFVDTEYVTADYLKKKLELSIGSIIRGLMVLEREKILVHTNIKDDPLGLLPVPRYKKFPFSGKELDKHRNNLLAKLEVMQNYADTRECRSRFLRIYFGEENVPTRCGKCDNCNRSQADDKMGALKSVVSCLQDNECSFDEIKNQTGLQRKIVDEVIGQLMSEQVINRIEDDKVRYRLIRKPKNLNSTISGVE